MMVIDNSSVLGLPASKAVGLLGQLGCGDLDSERTLAFVIWSHLCEPGDMVAGALVDRLGPIEALNCVRSANPAKSLLSALKQRDPGDELVTGCDESEIELQDAASRWKARDNNSAVLRSLEHWLRLKGQLVTPDSSDWPSSLSALGDGRPHVLWLRGMRESLVQLESAIAIVGSRNVSSYGQYCAQTIAEQLVLAGYLIVSGGAYGIDAEAHRGAITASGKTIAVLAGGGDRLYPVGNTQLLNDVMQNGCLLAELPPGNAPTRWRFLQRNRLIAALGQATVIVEMAIKSGAKNTMHHAMAMSRDVYAVPGSIASQTARGCNVAIAEGKARIVSGFEELVRELLNLPIDYGTRDELTALQQRVFDALSRQPLTPTRLSIKAGTSSSETTQALGQLQALGLAEARATGWRRTLAPKTAENPAGA